MKPWNVVISLALVGCSAGGGKLLDCAEGYERQGDYECVSTLPEPTLPDTDTPPTETGTPTDTGTTPPTDTDTTPPTDTDPDTDTPPTDTDPDTDTPPPTGATVWDLELGGSGFTPGSTVQLAIVDALGAVVAGDVQLADVSGQLTFSLPDTLADGASYRLDLLGDANGNGACDLLEGTWRVDVGPVTADVAETVDPVGDLDPAACATFP